MPCSVVGRLVAATSACLVLSAASSCAHRPSASEIAEVVPAPPWPPIEVIQEIETNQLPAHTQVWIDYQVLPYLAEIDGIRNEED